MSKVNFRNRYPGYGRTVSLIERKLTQKRRLLFLKGQQMKGRLEKFVILMGILAICLSTGVVHADLVALWEFDFGTGSDSFGDNHGTLRNGAIFSADSRIGTHSLELDGIDDHVKVDDASALNFTSAITIAAWINAETWEGKNARIMQKGNGDDQYRLTSEWDNMSFDLMNVGRLDTSLPPTGKWVHIAATYDGSQMCIYYDGEQVASKLAQGSIATTCDPLNIGTKKDVGAPSTDHFKGRLDDVAIFDHALSPQEIGHLYRYGAKSLISKGYMDKLVEEAETEIKEMEPQQAVDFLEKKIFQYEQQKEKDPDDIGLQRKLLVADLHFLLAKAKGAAGAPVQDVIAEYKRSISRMLWRTNYGPANFLWLFENAPSNDYVDVVKSFARNTNILSYNIYHIIEHFESSGNWGAFKLFLDTVFSEVDNPAYYAVVVAKGLKKDGVWANKFSKYSRSNPELTGFLFRKQEETARKYIAQKNFGKAAEIYRNIIGQFGPNQQKSVYELKLYECLFNGSQYDSVVHDLDSFIKNNKATNRVLACKAIMLKGQAYVQLGDFDQAMDAFVVIAIEYPETRQAPEANFFIGYCYMLQGKFDEAAEAFNIVVKDYPGSSCASKARSSLIRIKNTTE